MDNFFIRRKKREIPQTPQTQKPVSGDYALNVANVSTPEAALRVAAFHRAVELRAKTMSQLHIEYQKRASGGNYIPDNYGTSARLNYLLQVRPNPIMTASTLMQQAEINKILLGNAYIYAERDGGGDLMALWLANYGSYNPADDTFTLTYNATGGTRSVIAPAADVIHIPNTFRDPLGYEGLPTLRYALQVLRIAATNDEQTLDNAAKGGKMKLLLQEKEGWAYGVGGRANPEQMKSVADRVQDDIYERDVVLIPNVANVTPISQNAQQMELMESRKFSVREIARMTGVPPILLMDDSNSSYKSPEAATQEFLLRTIQPAIREWENELDSKLLTPQEYGRRRFHVCEQSLLRLDPKGQADLYKTLLEIGVMSPDELRYKYDLPSIPNGDKHYISTNLAEVGSEKLRGHEQEGGEA